MHYSRDYPAFVVVWTFAPASAEAGAAKLSEMLHDWIHNGLTEEELANWKTHFQGPRAMTMDTPHQMVDTHHATALQERIHRRRDALPERVNSVTLNVVKNVLRTELQSDK